MIGLMARGAYVPFHRLRRSEIQREFGGGPGKGERSVASHDEDSATMAVAATLEALAAPEGSAPRVSPGDLGGVYFATTTPPYDEKQSATLIAGALDLPETIRTGEFGGTLRAGTAALLAAADAVAAGGRPMLVAVADMREGGASGANEAAFGDAAAAFVVARETPDSPLLARLVGHASVALEIHDAWRARGDAAVRNWDERFQLEQGFGKAIPAALRALDAQCGLKPEDFARVLLPVGAKSATMLLSHGFKKEQLADPMADTVGIAGAAHPLLMLCDALDRARPGERILVLAYGEGVDAVAFEATDAAPQVRPRHAVADWIASKRDDLTYATFLKWRRRIAMEPPRRPEPNRPSAPFMRRRSRSNLGLFGTRCLECGTPQIPAQRVCYKCAAKDRMEPYGFRDRKGRLGTYSADYLTFSLSPPEIAAVVDFEGGGRLLCNMVDVRAEELRIGQPVEMTLRRMFSAGGIHSYFWKATGPR